MSQHHRTPDDQRVTLTGLAQRGKFPPLDKLIDTAAAAPRYADRLILNPQFLGKLETLTANGKVKLEFKPTSNPEAPQSVGPMLVTGADEDAGISVRALVMPNLVLR